MKDSLLITKATGEQALFDWHKLARSLERAGASPETAHAIAAEVGLEAYEGMSTKAIYKMALKRLKRHNHDHRPVAARYSLKQALLELGPSGYPFEKFVGKLFEAEGYQVQTSLLLQGHCVQHEVDVLASNAEKLIAVECKFHNRQGTVCDVKVPLYIHSRFRDLQAGLFAEQPYNHKTFEGWIFTNTRYTDDAAQYGRCAGMHLVGWNAEGARNLAGWIDRTGLHPLTCLTTLTRQEKQRLLDQKIVLVREILENTHLLTDALVPPGRLRNVLDEAEKVCTGSV